MKESKIKKNKSFTFTGNGERSISRDLAACLVLALAIIIGVVTAYEYFGRSKMLQQEIDDTADNYIHHLVQAVTFPVWNLDMSSLKRVCEAYSQNERFAFLKVTDPAGLVLYNFVRPGGGAELVERKRDIIIGQDKIGEVRMALSKAGYEQTLDRILFISSLTFVISVLVIYLTTGLLLEFFIKKPMNNLRKGMDRVAMGDFTYRFKKMRYREMAEIAERFNRMTSEIASRERRLEEVNDTLSKEVKERQRTSLSLSKSEKRYRALVETTSEGFMMVDDNQVMQDVNPAFCRMLGYNREEMLGSSLSDILGESASYRIRQCSDMDSEFELTVLSRGKEQVDIYVHATKLFESGKSHLTFAFITDISEYKRLAEALRESEEEYRTIAENTYDWEMWIDEKGSVRYVSPSCERVSGFSVSHFKQGPQKVQEIIHKDDRNIWDRFINGRNFSQDNLDMRLFRSDGLMRWVSLAGHEVFSSEGQSLGIRLSLRDITKRKFMEKQLHYEALHDPLTGLANRNLCLDRIIQAVERSRRRENYYFAIVFMDLDRFKIVNDSLGHAVGDKLLIEVSQRLLKLVRDLDTVSRFGGDEFILVLEELSLPREAIRIIKRVRDKLSEPVVIDGHTINISASYGAVLSPTDYLEPEKLLQNANIAMHQAKEAGRDRIKVFNTRMLDQAMLAMTMQNDLRSGIVNDELYLDYQPIYSLTDNSVVGFEALVRWEHPSKGLIMPGDFIPLAEETGLIFDLGRWVLARACKEMKSWTMLYEGARDMVVSVNVSGRQFSQPNLVDTILAYLREFDLPPRNIKIEITETAIMERSVQAIEMLNRLKSAGVKVSIDDFGTGYSSMSNLQEFPLDQLKIDLSFVRRIDQSKENIEIVKAIINLAHNLGLHVVAEGVENDNQQQVLSSLGCEFGQGFYYAKPLSFDKVEGYFKTGVLSSE